MHTPPTQEEKYLYLDQGRKSIYVFGLFSTVCLLSGNILFVYYNQAAWAYGLFVLLTAFYLLLSYIVGFLGKEFDWEQHKKICTKWFDKADSASVDIYLPVCREPFEIIKNTWDGVSLLRKAHPQINIYVLDDGKEDSLKDLARKYKFNYIRRTTNELKKAGNLRNAFKRTSGEFILILDADFIPRVDVLIETLPYMFEHPKCAIVQTPQNFKTNDHSTWVGQGAASVQELFYRLMQVNRDTFNGGICVGTCALYRRTSLEPHGGTAAIEYSEDVRTGFRLVNDGWRIFYLPINLCRGICPDSLRAFITQQYRWSMGSISLFFSKEFWKSNLTKMQMICYMNGQMYYIATGLAVIFSPLPGIYLLVFRPDMIHWYNLLFSIPSFIFSTLFMKYWMKSPMGLFVLRSRCVAYYAHLLALKDYLFNTLEEWLPTGSVKQSKRYNDFKILFLIFGILPIMISFMLMVYRIIEGQSPIDFLLMFLFWCLNMAIHWPVLWSFEEDQ